MQKINFKSSDNFQKKWLNENSIAEQNHTTFFKKAPWSDLKAHEIISKKIEFPLSARMCIYIYIYI